MARVETREGSPLGAEGHGEEHLDEWFARRLESQGIPLRNTAAITSRFLAVVGLAVALMAFLWAVSSVGPAPAPATSTTPTSTATNPGTSGTSTTPTTGNNNQGGGGAVSWKNVTVDVLNGYGASGAAGTAAAELRAAGWKVGSVTNAGTGTAQTYVVFLPGRKKEARAVSKKLGLGSPVPTIEAGVSPSSSSGVAIVLGPDGLPPLA
jgi:LytR cell envelope-related transcriptional attenuator